MGEHELVVVQTFNNRQEAELAVSALEAAEIDAMITEDSAGGMRPSLVGAGSGARVLVRAEDEQAAREVLDLPAKPLPA